MANSIGMSVRTVKSLVPEIRLFFQEHGAVLKAKPGVGYYLVVEDQFLYLRLKDSFSGRHFKFISSQETEKMATTIICRILADEGYVKIEDIADELYCSRSSLKQVMRRVRSMLEIFNLSLVSKPAYGVKIEGNEMNKRYCCLELFMTHDTYAKNYLEKTKYTDLFEQDTERIANIRHALLEVVRASGKTVYDKYIYRFSRYLTLMTVRRRNGCCFSFSKEQAEILTGLPEYGIARRIMEREREYLPDIPVEDSNEILSVEYLLLIWQDPTESRDYQQSHPIFYEMAQSYLSGMWEVLQDRWNIRLDGIPVPHDYFAAALIPLCVKMYFRELSFALVGRDIENNEICGSPVCVALANTLEDVIYKREKIHISTIDILDFAVRIYAAVNRIEYTYKKPRVLIESRSGKQACMIVRDKIEREIGKKWFECMEPIGFYEVRGLDQAQYDYMIINHEKYSCHYQLPYAYVDLIPTTGQMDAVRRNIVHRSFQLEALLAKFDFPEEYVIPDFDYTDMFHFLDLVSYRHAKNINSVAKLKQDLVKLDDTFVWNEVLFLIVGREHTEKNIFEIYYLSKKGVWKRKKISTIVFLSVDFQGDLQLLRLMEELARGMAGEGENLEKCVGKRATPDTLLELIRKNW
ncbi:MAG: helix-turn-helix domain-containing protein [Lachnospiraceae bacterium]|nr:helix-turn-helix domain-containing protein [Lachnospiraceae bacterium]